MTARVGNHKRVVVVANAKGELDTKLSTILFYRDLKKLTLNPITTPGDDFDKVLVGETSEFDLTSSGEAVGVTLVRAYAKILLYMYKSNDPQDPDDPIHAEVKINKIEFLNMASLSPLFPDDNTFWDNLTNGQLNTYSKDYSKSKDPIKLKCGDADPNNKLSILEYDTSGEKLTDRQIKPIIVYLPYEQMFYTQKGSREADFKDFAPRIVVHATYNGIETKYFIPRNGKR